ncbi:hypothetical protein CBR_g46825 [Chara braunii]|uniref:folate gamma-glutamyl hydrolase n=1 Tax=Chara braunii TaxID=69332 RepID=A0A388M1A3_CHABU|nr:hypothetical protein CBR_g46825 [Chara braunii]|eukprot:GBG88259.1 hypothetical protein CBR_g46825 [Chara braunii]
MLRVVAIAVVIGLAWLDLSTSPIWRFPVVAASDFSGKALPVEQELDAFGPAVARRRATGGDESTREGGGGEGGGGGREEGRRGGDESTREGGGGGGGGREEGRRGGGEKRIWKRQVGSTRPAGGNHDHESQRDSRRSLTAMPAKRTRDSEGRKSKEFHRSTEKQEGFRSDSDHGGKSSKELRARLGRRGGGGGGPSEAPVDYADSSSDLVFPRMCTAESAMIRRRSGRKNWKPVEPMVTDSPIIGVLTLPVTAQHFLKHGQQYFAASYARWMEAGGARVVPIFFDSTPEELDYLLHRVNGVFWTGGLVTFNPSPEDWPSFMYMQTTRRIMQHVLEENRNGRYYPLWGTCLGHERLLQLLVGGLTELEDDGDISIFDIVDAVNWNANLNFTAHLARSHLFSGLPFHIIQAAGGVIGRNLAFHNHELGLSPEAFYKTRANEELMVLSIDSDRKGSLFISTVEGKSMPLYGTQWHPEKIPWEWPKNFNITHSPEGVQLSNYMGRFFVDECRCNWNRFENEDAENEVLLYNWQPLPTQIMYGATEGIFTQVYFFGNRDERCQKDLYSAFVIDCERLETDREERTEVGTSPSQKILRNGPTPAFLGNDARGRAPLNSVQ